MASSDLHGLTPAQYGIETALVLIFGACFAIAGAIVVLFPRASHAYRMRQWAKAVASARSNVLYRFVLWPVQEPSFLQTYLLGSGLLMFGLFAVWTGVEGLQKLLNRP